MDPPPRRRRGLKILVVVAVCLIGLISCIAAVTSNGPTPSSAPAPARPASPAPASSAEPDPDGQTYGFGETATSGGLSLKAAAPKAVSDPIGSYYCTTVTYVNDGAGQVSFNAYDWKLTDSEGVIVSPTFGGTKNYLGTGELGPHGRKVGDVCFDKQGAGQPQALIYDGGIFSTTVQFVAR